MAAGGFCHICPSSSSAGWEKRARRSPRSSSNRKPPHGLRRQRRRGGASPGPGPRAIVRGGTHSLPLAESPMLGAIFILILLAAAAYAVTQVGGVITLAFVAAILFLAYKRLPLLTFTATFTVLLAAYTIFGADSAPA